MNRRKEGSGRNKIPQAEHLMDSLALVHGISGILGGCSAMAVTYPLLTVTTRQQVRSDEEKGNPITAIWNILTKEGPASLYSGIGPALFGVSATMGVYIYSYEVGSQKTEEFLFILLSLL